MPNKFRRKAFLKQLCKIDATIALHKRLQGFSSCLTFIDVMLGLANLPSLSCNQEHVAKAMFNGCIVRAFEASASGFSGDTQDRLYNLMLITTRDPSDIDMVEVPYSHPYAFCVGRFVDDAYMDCMKMARLFDTLYGGE